MINRANFNDKWHSNDFYCAEAAAALEFRPGSSGVISARFFHLSLCSRMLLKAAAAVGAVLIVEECVTKEGKKENSSSSWQEVERHKDGG
jgi:hypothetical protein